MDASLPQRERLSADFIEDPRHELLAQFLLLRLFQNSSPVLLAVFVIASIVIAVQVQVRTTESETVIVFPDHTVDMDTYKRVKSIPPFFMASATLSA